MQNTNFEYKTLTNAFNEICDKLSSLHDAKYEHKH